MRMRVRRAVPFALAALLLAGAFSLTSVFAGKRAPVAPKVSAPDPSASAEAARFNSIGVAYMGQQRFGEAQKQFESALKAQPDYALAKLNLGIALLAQQKSDEALKALLEATQKLPGDPFAWY